VTYNFEFFFKYGVDWLTYAWYISSLTIVSKEFADKTEFVEEWYGVKYNRKAIESERIKVSGFEFKQIPYSVWI